MALALPPVAPRRTPSPQCSRGAAEQVQLRVPVLGFNEPGQCILPQDWRIPYYFGALSMQHASTQIGGPWNLHR